MGEKKKDGFIFYRVEGILIANSRKIMEDEQRELLFHIYYGKKRVGLGQRTRGNAEYQGFQVSKGVQDICIPLATGSVGCRRWI